MNDNQVIKEIVRSLGQLTENLGLGSLPGIIYGTLYFYADKTQDELKNELGVGLSSISQSLSVLEKFGFVVFKSKVGRKKVYGINEGKRDWIENMLRFNLEPFIGLMQTRLSVIKNKDAGRKIANLCGSLNSMKGCMRKML